MKEENDSDVLIFRSDKIKEFTTFGNTLLQSETISYKAQGILTYLLSLPPDWKIYMKNLHGKNREGRDAVISGMKELTEAGYVVRKTRRDAKGRIRTVTCVYEEPRTTPDDRRPGNPVDGKPGRLQRTQDKDTSSLIDTYTPKNTNTKKSDEISKNEVQEVEVGTSVLPPSLHPENLKSFLEAKSSEDEEIKLLLSYLNQPYEMWGRGSEERVIFSTLKQTLSSLGFESEDFYQLRKKLFFRSEDECPENFQPFVLIEEFITQESK